ncbi:MAG: DUF3644 domain-containing protein [Lachnospiraceae bacterium]|jgi:hypothetical protein|nr:DUF3644 domain-containing protein [Lachnospiraceae bacterium]
MIYEKLIEKSKEAFVMAIEIYNKPTIKYRVEGFSFFICNAWELMLKAHMICKFGENSIYYKDNPGRTITLENCIQKIFTNEKGPLRRNLIKIIELRNTSTHFITEEYEMIYIPLFQACVLNFVEKMQEFHEVDMTQVVPQNFLTLAVSMKSLDENAIRAKYPEEIAEKILETNHRLVPMIQENNQSFAIKIEHYHYITKDRNKATSFVHLDRDAEAGVKIIKELKDPNNTHKYTMKTALKEINRQLQKAGLDIKMNAYHFDLFNKVFGLKENEKYCYVHKIYAQPSYSYSMQAVELIVDEIKKDPEHMIERLKISAKK